MTPSTRTDPTAFRLAVGVLVALLLLTGCSAPPDTSSSVGPPPADPAPSTPIDREPEVGTRLVVRASDTVDVHDDPAAPEPVRTLPATTGFGSPTVLLVLRAGTGAAAGWLEVSLPSRPNGATGWVRADDLELQHVEVEVEVDLDARQLSVRQGDAVLLEVPTAIGDADHPTPTGTYFVTDKLDTDDPDGPYGPYAVGLSAYSEVLTEFAGGDGQVGIHGTNVPASVGEAASRGCLRVDNGVIEQLVGLLPLGTPVTIF
jgi:hypothetical protein